MFRQICSPGAWGAHDKWSSFVKMAEKLFAKLPQDVVSFCCRVATNVYVAVKNAIFCHSLCNRLLDCMAWYLQVKRGCRKSKAKIAITKVMWRPKIVISYNKNLIAI